MKNSQRNRSTAPRAIWRALAIFALTVSVTAAWIIQPFARETVPTVTITELAGSVPLHPDGTIEVDRGALTMTLLDEDGKSVMLANYAPEIVEPYISYIMAAGVNVLVVGDPHKNTPWIFIVTLALVSAFSALGGAAFVFSRRDELKPEKG